jgi:hypothetical protein
MPKFNTTSRVVSEAKSSYTAEAELVQQRAERYEPSVIRRGQIVFFSTETGDAWMLDAKDGEAACLAREGQRDPIPIEESADKFGVAWQGFYRFEEDLSIAMRYSVAFACFPPGAPG